MTSLRTTASTAAPASSTIPIATDDGKADSEVPRTQRAAPAVSRKHTAPRFLVVLDHAGDWQASADCAVIDADAFLAGGASGDGQPLVVNLCRSYKYLSVGYYCSLMAQARGQAVLPSVQTINDLSRKAIYTLDTGELDHGLNEALGALGAAPLPVEFSMDIAFGKTSYTPLAALAQRIFDTFPVPLLRVEFVRDAENNAWRIAAIRMQSAGMVGERQRAALLPPCWSSRP